MSFKEISIGIAIGAIVMFFILVALSYEEPEIVPCEPVEDIPINKTEAEPDKYTEYIYTVEAETEHIIIANITTPDDENLKDIIYEKVLELKAEKRRTVWVEGCSNYRCLRCESGASDIKGCRWIAPRRKV